MAESGPLQQFLPYLPSVLSLVFTAILLVGSHKIIRRMWDRSVGRDVVNGMLQVFIGLIGLVVFVMLLPISQANRENILQFGGLILTGIVGFSSTAMIRDAAAGVTLRLVSPFTRGDYLKTDGVFGRITEIGFFYTEVQTEDRSLVTLMNSNLLSQDFRTIPSSGTLLQTELSIGYDVHHERVSEALKEAADALDLEDPFVHLENLGNYAVTYRVAALLTDVDKLLTARSNFRKEVLDAMHRHDIEIVSPDFTNRRSLDPAERFIPDSTRGSRTDSTGTDAVPDAEGDQAERTSEVVFEKALEAQEAEQLKELLEKLNEQMDQLKSSDTEDIEESVEALQSRIKDVEAQKKQVEEQLSEE